jgi:RNA polymerase sigma factor (sigma-70 family)
MVVVRLAPTARQDHAVEDLAQQSLMNIVEGLPTLRNPVVGALKRFASTVVMRRVADYLRVGRAGPARPAASLDSSIAYLSSVALLREILPASELTPRSMAARAELGRNVLDEIAQLKDEHRTVVAMAYFDQLPIGDIAEHFGISKPAASMLLVRAIKTLRRNITGTSKLGPVHDSGRA